MLCLWFGTLLSTVACSSDRAARGAETNRGGSANSGAGGGGTLLPGGTGPAAGAQSTAAGSNAGGSPTAAGAGGQGGAGGVSGSAAGAALGGSGGATTTTFSQGLFRGQDPRLSRRNGFYYYVGYVGQQLEIFKSKSLVDLGVGKPLPAGMTATLFAPVYIDTLGGVAYNAWYVFGSSIWRCNGADPYDNADQWAPVISNLPFTATPFDFELFQNPQPGPYQNRWYLLWTASVPGGYAESIYAAEVLSLTPGQTTLSSYNSDPGSTANRIITYQNDWTDIITEAPGTAIHDSTVTVAYSGNGAQTSLYAVGFSLLKVGQNPALASSWIDYSHGGCDGNVHNGPEFARTNDVLGPGVVRFTQSASGKEDWMLYHAKVFDTFDAKANKPEPQQLHNEEYTRYVNLQPFSWQDVTCSGHSYSIPNMGKPLAPGASQRLPSGDVGVGNVTATRRIEAEYMIPFGDAMGSAVQSLPTNNTVVLTPTDSSFSSGNASTHFDELAQGVASDPKQSGLILRNAPGGHRLVVAAAGVTAGNFELYLDHQFVKSLPLQATAGEHQVLPNSFDVAIPAGSELKLVYQVGKSAPASIDYIEISP